MLSIPMPALTSDSEQEVWIGNGEIRRGWKGAVSYSWTDDILFGVIEYDTGDDLAASAREAYLQLVGAARAEGFPHLLRVWNHVAHINDQEYGVERYKQFCRGRAEALERLGYRLGDDLPAASAVGSRGDGIYIYFLAGRYSGQQVENPRQISAYCYPQQYGPRSPSFSRATVARWPGARQLFVSGTSSVVGHQSMHTGDIAAQLEETLHNIRSVIGGVSSASLSDFDHVKIYVRNPAELPLIHDRIVEAFGAAPLAFLEADICRRELLLEIEGIVSYT